MSVRAALGITAAWLAFIGWAIWHEWSRPARDQFEATVFYVLFGIMAVSFVWPFVERKRR